MKLDYEAGATTRTQLPTDAGCGDQQVLGVRWASPSTSVVTKANCARLVVGRGADCDVVFSGSEISRQHAELLRKGPHWLVRDLGSRNGVYVNGRRVDHVVLSRGDVLRIGEWVGVVRPLASASVDDEVPFGQLAPGILGSTVIARVLRAAKTAACSELRVIIQGETGTGKERVARAIHAWSGRNGHFVAVNCAALPESMAEAELFGCRKGAFTGADQARLGHLRSAHGGTLLLDEITELPLTVQAKLLRALEQRAVVPLGESMPIPVDIRIIAATQESLRGAVEQNRFRTDLWMRLNGLTIVLPPLRERSEDAPGLFEHLMPRVSGARTSVIEARLVEQLCLYDWPGNVREVAQLAEQLAVLHGHEASLRRSHLPDWMLLHRDLQIASEQESKSERSAAPASGTYQQDANLSEEVLLQALRRNQGNMTRAACELGISRGKAYRLLGNDARKTLRKPSRFGGCS